MNLKLARVGNHGHIEPKDLYHERVRIPYNFFRCSLTKFRCSLTIIIDQGVHFINDIIKHLIEHFFKKHVSSITYYPRGNGQAESTNKVIGRLLTKLVNEKKTNWDEHMSTFLFSYKTTYKVATSYTPYELMYDLHPPMST